jgi:DNA-binding NarL/FixJ family response regulator
MLESQAGTRDGWKDMRGQQTSTVLNGIGMRAIADDTARRALLHGFDRASVASPVTRAPIMVESVAVVDGHDATHAAIESWCSQTTPQIRFAGSYFSADQFLDAHPSPTLSGVGAVVLELEQAHHRVDFAVLDQIVQRRHQVIVYSHAASEEVILTSLDRGARTYVAKSERKDHLLAAIHAACTDTPYVGPKMERAMRSDGAVGRPNLAPREREVLIAWVRTESKDLVAQQLDIAPTTVRTHLQRVRAKYAAVGRPATTKASLVARAIQDGIINVNDI